MATTTACAGRYDDEELTARRRELVGGVVAFGSAVPLPGPFVPQPGSVVDGGADAPDGLVNSGSPTLAIPSGGGTTGLEAGSTTPPTGASSVRGGVGTGGAAGTSGDRSEIVVATVGNYSGIPGVVYRDAPSAVQAWAQAVNDGGGIDGHPVRVIVKDDGSDPSKHVAILKDLVENQGVVAFVAHYAPLSGAAGIEYLESEGVPVVGGEPAETWWSSPVFFNHTASGANQFHRQVFGIREHLDQLGKSNVGILVCAEAGSCAAAANQWKRFAPEAALNIVYDSSTSVAQPDYTAECLAMRRNNVEFVLTSLDGNSIRRLAGSCARQGYRPTIWLQGGAAQLQMVEDPNLSGLRATSGVYPYFMSSVPGAVEMHGGLGPRLGDVDTFNVVTSAYAGAKLFQTAVEGIKGSITSEAVIASLHNFRNETLGGLIAPVTYRPGSDTSSQALCWFQNGIEGGKFMSPTNGALSCAR